MTTMSVTRLIRTASRRREDDILRLNRLVEICDLLTVARGICVRGSDRVKLPRKHLFGLWGQVGHGFAAGCVFPRTIKRELLAALGETALPLGKTNRGLGHVPLSVTPSILGQVIQGSI